MRDNSLKIVLSWLVVFTVRLIPWRIPNVEGIMATLMPASKRFGVPGSFTYGFFAIAIFDFAVGKVGSWTLLTACTYGVIGVASYYFFKRVDAKALHFAGFSIVATIFYDAITGVIAGPVLWGMPLAQAFFGQIPFTLYHLAGNIIFALVLSPALYRWIISNESLETSKVLDWLRARTAR